MRVMKQTIILVILDGWGIGEQNETNAIYMAQPKTMQYIEERFPGGALKSSGLSVGLPWGEEGNSEVGHLTLGAGRVLYQHYLKISKAIEDGAFFKNKPLVQAYAHARKHNSALHLVGILTKSNVHASFNHLTALIEMASREKITNLYLHVFTDGRDSAPRSALKLLTDLKKVTEKYNVGIIATLAGRYYGMDRDNRWDRTQKAYDVLTGEGEVVRPEDVLNNAYGNDLSDEYVKPAIVGGPHPITDNDAVIFFNFREDRMRQLNAAFGDTTFDAFPVKQMKNVYLATMTRYDNDQSALVAFPSEQIHNTLGEFLAEHNKTQLRIAETEKYAHVTYFFNGLHKEPFDKEYRILIPSAQVARYDKYPQMRAEAITDRAILSLRNGAFDFILLNFANADMVAHTGNYHATIQAVTSVDTALGKLVKEVLAGGHTMILTSDHGNAEVIFNKNTGESETKHNPSPVPCYLIGNTFKKNTPQYNEFENAGLLADIAPTILELMKLTQPSEMTGASLLNILQ